MDEDIKEHESKSQDEHSIGEEKDKRYTREDEKIEQMKPVYNKKRNKNKKCFEFERKGHCSRGEKCPYLHAPLNIGGLPLIPTYEVVQSLLNNEMFTNLLQKNKEAFDYKNTINNYEMKSKQDNKKNLFPLSKSGRVSKSLLIKKIPPLLMDINKINEYFSKFGNITNVILKYEDQSNALIEFSSSEEAKSAYECPDAILGNRFISAYYNKPQIKVESMPVIPTNELKFVDPEILSKNEETKKEQEKLESEFMNKRKELIELIDQKSRSILEQLRNVNLPTDEREKLTSEIKQLMLDKDKLVTFNVNLKKEAKRFKFGVDNPSRLDRRPNSLSVQMHKFSNPTDILNHFSKFGTIIFSRVDSSNKLIIGFATHNFAQKAYREATLALSDKFVSMELLSEYIEVDSTTNQNIETTTPY